MVEEVIVRVAEAIWDAAGSGTAWVDVKDPDRRRYRHMALMAIGEVVAIMAAEESPLLPAQPSSSQCCASCDGHACDDRRPGQ